MFHHKDVGAPASQYVVDVAKVNRAESGEGCTPPRTSATAREQSGSCGCDWVVVMMGRQGGDQRQLFYVFNLESDPNRPFIAQD